MGSKAWGVAYKKGGVSVEEILGDFTWALTADCSSRLYGLFIAKVIYTCRLRGEVASVVDTSNPPFNGVHPRFIWKESLFMLIKKSVVSMALLLASSLTLQAQASVFTFTLTGPGVSGSVALTYGTSTDARYPQAYEVTGISGVFSDSNNSLGIVNAAILSLVPITHAIPEVDNLLAPNDFSRFAVANGLEHGSLSYDNLFYPGGSPQTASDYPFHGGFFDIYGLLFNIEGGKVVNLWSDGNFLGGPIVYGVAVADKDIAFDYIFNELSVSETPEPLTFGLFSTALLGLVASRRRTHA
jgi:hypothetical protein